MQLLKSLPLKIKKNVKKVNRVALKCLKQFCTRNGTKL